MPRKEGGWGAHKITRGKCEGVRLSHLLQCEQRIAPNILVRILQRLYKERGVLTWGWPLGKRVDRPIAHAEALVSAKLNEQQCMCLDCRCTARGDDVKERITRLVFPRQLC